jgi:hypothetical protein
MFFPVEGSFNMENILCTRSMYHKFYTLLDFMVYNYEVYFIIEISCTQRNTWTHMLYLDLDMHDLLFLRRVDLSDFMHIYCRCLCLN